MTNPVVYTVNYYDDYSFIGTMILKVLNTMTTGKEVVISSIDSIKDVFNVMLDPAVATSSMVV